MGFWKATLSGVVAAVFGAWAAGFIPGIWAFIAALPGHASAALQFNISGPVWLGLLILFAAVLITVLAVKRGAALENEKSEKFGRGELGIIDSLTRADGRTLSLEHLIKENSLSGLYAEQCIETLMNHDFVDHKSDSLFGDLFRLSPKGRAYALARIAASVPGS